MSNPSGRRIHLVNPRDTSIGVAVITPRRLYMLAAATATRWGDRHIVEENAGAVGLRRNRERQAFRHNNQ